MRSRGTPELERRGRRWLAWSFLACPCHLPLTLGILAGVLGGTALGAALHEHRLLAGAVIAATWLAGTARGFLLIRRAARGELTCELPPAPHAVTSPSARTTSSR